MDIPVSQLNRRLGVQLPAELPLGLVFVLGRAADLEWLTDGRLRFWLIEGEHRILCVLTERAAAETELAEGDEVRAGGHLAFDDRLAGYYLLARDVEVALPVADMTVPAEPKSDQAALREMLAEVSRRSKTAVKTDPDLPGWVQRLAPAGLQADFGEKPENEPSVMVERRPSLADRFALNDELIAFLSDAMDKDEDVELSPDLLQELGAPVPVEPPPALPDISPIRPPTPAPPDMLMTFFIATLLIVSVLVLLALLMVGLSG